ncbi:MAG: hypothetical protein AB7N76_30410 [Planctomycetota bacterium]
MEPQDAAPQPESPTEPERRGGLFYKIALAGVGGVMLAQEELASFFRKTERPAEESAPEEESSEEQAPLPEGGHDWLDTTIDRVLHTFNVPSRADVDALAREVAALSARLEAYRQQG